MISIREVIDECIGNKKQSSRLLMRLHSEFFNRESFNKKDSRSLRCDTKYDPSKLLYSTHLININPITQIELKEP